MGEEKEGEEGGEEIIGGVHGDVGFGTLATSAAETSHRAWSAV